MIKSRHKIRGIRSKVKVILTDVPATRNSDYILYEEYIRRTSPDALRLSVEQFLLSRPANLPTIESVGRERRKLQEEHEELRGSDDMQAVRAELEEYYRLAYAR